MMHALREAWRHIWQAAGHSLAGIHAAWRDELPFRIEIVVLLIALPSAWWLAESALQMLLLIAFVVLTLACELVNTAIEAAIDRIGPQRHPLAKKAKDCGSAAVMLCAIATALVWLGALIDRLHG